MKVVEQTGSHPLYRVREGAYFGGVCGGLANRYDVDAIAVRILAVLLAGFTLGAACIVYAVLWARLPVEPDRNSLYDVMPENAESSAFGCVDSSMECERGESYHIPFLARLAVAAGLMVLFLSVAINVSPLVPGTYWWQFWPLGFLMLGLCLIIIPIRVGSEMLWHCIGVILTSISACMLPITLCVIPWMAVGFALERLWPVLVVAVVLAIAGYLKHSEGLMLASSFCVVVFCLVGIAICAIGIPAELGVMTLSMQLLGR